MIDGDAGVVAYHSVLGGAAEFYVAALPERDTLSTSQTTKARLPAASNN